MRLPDWHDRYLLQSIWTQNLRSYILQKINLKAESRVLDVGSGTGALFSDLQQRGFDVTGLDFDRQRCLWSKGLGTSAEPVCGDASAMPFRSAAFDLSLCHYLLLWTKNPEQVIAEMRRVTAPGGYLVAFAEPDYESRIDYPEIFRYIGSLQNRSLTFQGVNLQMGRQLGMLFRGMDLQNVSIGLLAGQWKQPIPEEFENEWNIIAFDLGGMVPAEKIVSLKENALQTWLSGSATVFIPTFFAFGQVPAEA